MKTIFVICVAALLAGCSQKPDPRMAEIQTQLGLLQGSIDEMKTHLNSQSNYMKGIYAIQTNMCNVISSYSNLDAVGQYASALGTNNFNDLRMDVAEVRLTLLENQFSNLCLTINGKVAAHAIPVSYSGPMSAYRNGIPVDVYQQIVADAQQRHPGDYQTQQYVIEEQVTSYKSLHSLQ
ncbi:MAG TPA: hypothetical protein VK742_20360 [Candidatus Sulfotelmatobacter sp.]|jgi:hypothetical protein|nr:hypothetical protein [Candidatus Sulfotelmatobacter sp.]